jgi:hypothetical protein
MVPQSAGNIALGKPVTSSDAQPRLGNLSMITDGDKEGYEGHWVELGKGLQWVQIDLGRRSRIYGVHLWHFFGIKPSVFRDVIVQVCDENTFTKNVRTIYNNDGDNSSGLGKGKDREFYEHNHGYRIDTRGKNYEGIMGRFVRLYSNGSSFAPQNHYIEIEIIGEPYHPNRNLFLWKPYVPPADYNSGPRKPYNLQRKLKPLPDFWVPRGAQVISKGKPVNSSDDFPLGGVLSMINDGIKENNDYSWVELGPGPQWVQIDFLQTCAIYGLHIWHRFDESRVYRDVIVQVADDANFTENVRTLFNNDEDGSLGFGKGNDKEYYETNLGFLLDVTGRQKQGVKARFVRLYSRGNTSDPQNHYIEVEIIGQPAAQLRLKDWTFKVGPLTYTTASVLTSGSDVRRRYGNKILHQPQAIKSFRVPLMARNLAWRKPMTFSSEAKLADPKVVTDGNVETNDGSWVQLGPGLQWAQIDLGEPCFIYAIRIVRDYYLRRVFDDVIVQVTDDADFQYVPRTLFNNDHDHSSGLGIGIGREPVFYESRHGLILDTRSPQIKTNLRPGYEKGITLPGPASTIGLRGRYLRFWSNGNTSDKTNDYLEIEVIGETEKERTTNPIPLEKKPVLSNPKLQLKEWETAYPAATYN